MALFEAQDLRIAFGGIRAVDGITFSVEKSSIFTIIGPNGAGKTTIFNLISGILQPSGGRLLFDGRDITRMPAHRVARFGIGRTFQNIELFDNASVAQNILVGHHARIKTGLVGEIFRLPSVVREEVVARRRVEEIIDFLRLQRYRDTPVGGLAYGLRKMVEFGRALASEPRLLLLDEPSSVLNLEETDEVGFWIRDIRDTLGITVIMVEHDMRLVSAVSDCVMAVNYGRMLAMGSPAHVQRHPDVVAAYLGA
jgi:branched-chain amino acid transport system ATP-binding protein